MSDSKDVEEMARTVAVSGAGAEVMMLDDLVRLGSDRFPEGCGVHDRPQWTCAFCLYNMLAPLIAQLAAARQQVSAKEAVRQLLEADITTFRQQLTATREQWVAMEQQWATMEAHAFQPQGEPDTDICEVCDMVQRHVWHQLWEAHQQVTELEQALEEVQKPRRLADAASRLWQQRALTAEAQVAAAGQDVTPGFGELEAERFRSAALQDSIDGCAKLVQVLKRRAEAAEAQVAALTQERDARRGEV